MSGLFLIDKPGGMTSHDVVSRVRRARNTRRVGHAGTLDPMATGLLLIGVGGSTRLLTFLVGLDKTYLATIRLGSVSSTDDADGEVVASAGPSQLADLGDEAIAAGVAALTGALDQVPSRVSAIKVDGRRAYDRVRAGEDVELAARRVTVSRFDVLDIRRTQAAVDLDVVVDVTSGTYVRALARDLGDALGVGGHLTALRRTRVGPFDVADAVDADAVADTTPLPPAEVAGRVLGRLDVTADEARDLRHGKRIEVGERMPGARAAAIGPDGALVGVVEPRGDAVKSVMNLAEEAP